MRPGLAAAACFLAAGAAQAHGAAPVALGVQFVEKNGVREPVVETNYGLLERDATGAWRLTCSEVLEPGGKFFSVAADGAIGLGFGSGFARSDDGCEFVPSTGVDASIANVQRVGNRVFLVLEGISGPNLRRSVDDGRTFAVLDVPGSQKINAIRATPAGTLVATSSAGGTTFSLFTSTDFGDHWDGREFTVDEGVVRVLAITGSGVFFRHLVDGENRLLRLVDGTLETVLTTDTPAAFVAETAPGDIWVSGQKEVHRSRTGGAAGSWERTTDAGDLLCLVREGDVLYACLEDDGTRIAVRTSTDGGRNWADFLRFPDIAGTVTCPAGSDVETACGTIWLVDALAFGAKLKEDPPPPPRPETGCTCAGSGASWLALLMLHRRASGRAAGRRPRPPAAPAAAPSSPRGRC